ncbi:MAG: A/G-specific adenine glycosylase [Pseudonocardiales bacterium]|nr:A/G-specific adenine glycosylase [Pseudonocardiales bacterium]
MSIRAATPTSRSDSDDRSEPTALSQILVQWYDANSRDLPWRAPGTSPWAILVSEIMLQQTPVARVEPVWRAWMERWPSPSALAGSTPGDAVRMWAKLGYPRRALRLHECARAIVHDHSGDVPTDIDSLLDLPGVGAYTARAVATFAFGQRHPVVDINVRRVVARAVLGRGEAGPASTRRDLADVELLLPRQDRDAARFSIALMELGAIVCRAASPRCGDCPISSMCRWRRAGYPPYEGPVAAKQKFTGTDRQVRGRLLDVLRGSAGPVHTRELDLAWPEPIQRTRALDSLVSDGLVDPLEDGRFALPGPNT